MAHSRYRIAVLAFICACSGPGGTSARSDGSVPPQCVDLAWRGETVRGGATIWNGQVYVYWDGTLVSDNDSGVASDLETRAPVLGETALTQDGATWSTVKRKLFPAGTPSNKYGMLAMAAAVGKFTLVTSTMEGHSLATGTMDQDSASVIAFDPASDSYTTTFIGWDGDAFNVELQGSDRSTLVMRTGLDGATILPETSYGRMLDLSYKGLDVGYKTSTNPISGATYSFSAPSGRSITGHTREGKTVPWIPANSMLTLPLYSGNGLNPDGGAANPAVSADDEGGVWIAWSQSTNRDYMTAGVQHIAADGTVGPTTWFNSPPYDPRGSRGQSVLARSSSRALLVSSTGAALYTYDVDGEKISDAHPLTEMTPNPAQEYVDYREMQIISDGATDWLVMDQGTQRTMAVRVLKIAPGCVYPTHPAELLTL